MNSRQPKTTVKDHALQALARKPNQTAKELHNYLKNEFTTKPPTYQAVHKTLAQLVISGEVIQNIHSRKYALSEKYVNNLEEHLQFAKQTHGSDNRPVILDLKVGESVKVEFDGKFLEPYHWLLQEVFNVNRARGKSKNVVFFMYGVWPLTDLSQTEYLSMKEAFCGSRVLILSDSSPANKRWDAFFGQHWKEIGATVFSIAPYPFSRETDVFVFHDFVVNVEVAPSLFNTALRITQKFTPMHHFSKVFSFLHNAKGKVTLSITRNPSLANYYYRTTPSLSKNKFKLPAN